ncbi:MAG TPA: S8 family serine peptidase [Thermoanaerobaculia bacterium]
MPGDLPAQPKDPKGPALRSARLLIRKSADRESAPRFGEVLDDYGSYVVLRLPEAALRRARGAGLDIELLEENVGLGAFRFDPGEGAPSVPPAFADDDHGPDPRYYIVQFHGPIREEWIAGVRSKGVEPINYVPDNAMLVRATPAQMAVAGRGREVRWSGLFHPAYKLGPDLEWLLGKPVQRIQSARQFYRVSAFKTNGLEDVLEEVEGLGGNVDQVDDAVDGVYFRNFRVELDTEKLAGLAALRDVARIETWFPREKEDERSNQIVAGNYTGTTVTATGYASFLTAKGVNGAGIAVGVVDDGVDVAEMHLTGRVTDTATIRRGAAAGAEGHGHHDAGIVAGQCNHTDPDGFFYASGMAPQAHILNIPLLRSGYSGSDSNAQADIVTTTAGNGSAGTVSTNSWGAGPGSAYGSREALYDALVHDASSATAGQQPLAIIFSAGNSGPGAGTLTSPKAAKNIVAVGASENYRPLQGSDGNNIDQWASFSSRGPTNDNRIKPDISAPGVWIASARSGPDALWGNIDASHRYSSGTSQACPHVAGATALIQQWWKTTHAGQLPAPALSKAMLINGAVDPTADPAGFAPNNTEGWGRMNLAGVLNPGVATLYNNQENVLTNAGQTYTISGNVADPSKPFRVTLVWSDAPGAAGANPALVNNLDLEVSFGATTYKGNVFTNGASTAGGTSDTRNNVEGIHFAAGAVSGAFSLTVRATALAGDGAQGTGDTTDQHFALVVSNATTCASPLAPATASAAPNGNNRIDVTFAAAAGATSYRVLRGTTSGGPYTQVGTAAGSPFVDTTVSAFVTYYYVVRAIGPNCESAHSPEASAMATGTIGVPGSVTAQLMSATNVSLTWTGVLGAQSYRVYRTSNNSIWTPIVTTPGTQYLDTTAVANTAYLYKVRAVAPTGAESTDSNKALATTVVFTDLRLTAGTTTIKAVHFTQLRTAVNAVRLLNNTGGFAFTDPALSSSTIVKRVHLTELRGALDPVRTSLGLPAYPYTDPTILAGATRIKRAHIEDLRLATGAYMIPPPVNTQILLNPGFEEGAANWTATAGVIGASAQARTGSYFAWLNGYGNDHIDTLEQQVTIPSGATAATLSFWLKIATSETTTTTAYDNLRIQILDPSGTILATLATYSNLDQTSDAYQLEQFDVLAYKGQTIRVRFYGIEDFTLATSFMIDDTALDVEQQP